MKKIKNKIIKLLSLIVVKWYSFLKVRPRSRNYITGDSFRSLCDYFWDEWQEPSFDPSNIKPGSVIFVSNWNIPRFIADFEKRIQVPYILITSNGDQNNFSTYLNQPSKYRKGWFSQNVISQSPNVVPIPIGLENRRSCWNGNVNDFDRLRKYPILPEFRKFKIIYGFTMSNGTIERQEALSVLVKHPLAEKCNTSNPYEYRRTLRMYGFVASPPGNGEDCHRTWEALYLRVIPIVRRSVMMEYFVNLGLPILIIDKWEELNLWNEDFLKDKYQELESRFDHPALGMNFWISKLRGLQNS